MFDRPLAMRQRGDVLVVEGTIDEYCVGDLRERLTAMVEGARRDTAIVVDVSDVDFLPSAGIGVLVRARARMRTGDGDLEIVAVPGCPAQRTLAIAGIPYRADLNDDDGPGSSLRA